MKRFLSLILALLLCACALADGVKVPDLSLKEKDAPENEALAFTRAMGAGWNLGNTFDVNDASWLRNEMAYETAWQPDKTTEKLIRAIHEAGFDTIRIPVSWHNHVDGNFIISKPWLDRVTEVVDWAYSCGMYVIINLHHDCGKAFYYPSKACLESSQKYIAMLWAQLAAHFRDYDEHLIFENMNEPRLKDTAYEWSGDFSIREVAEAAECINALNQTMVSTVRASGGNNAKRYLMLSGYAASIEGAATDLFRLPRDSAKNRLIVSVHAYTPYSFALQGMNEAGAVDHWSHTEYASISSIVNSFERLYKKYITQGIPVVMGEFGSVRKGDNLSSRVDHAAYCVYAAAIRHIPAVWWDNNNQSGTGEQFCLIDRKTCRWVYPEIRDAIIRYRLR